MKPKTRGEAEAEITKAVIQFEKEYLGRGPLDARTTFLNDMLLIRLKGILKPGDRELAETQEGQTLLKEPRRRILESSCDFFYQMVQDVTGCRRVSFHLIGARGPVSALLS